MLALANLAALALDDQTQLRECAALALGRAEASQHLVPGVRRVADAELLEGGALEPTSLEILARARARGRASR